MARQLRIDYPGAFYHVYSRGNQKQPIYVTDDDRSFFLNLLRRAHERFGVIIHAYCLMPNHFHLALETPADHLSRMMHFLITSYTVYFNKKHDRHGHLFQGRFRAILIEAVVYARELSRYIHLNPVRARLVESPEDYCWSSYRCFTGQAAPARWLDIYMILKLFNDDLTKARTVYAAYIREGMGLETPRALVESAKRGILGSEEFIARIKEEHLREFVGKSDREKPQLRKLREKPDLQKVLALSERVLGPRNKCLIPIAVYISHNNSSLKLKEIGAFFALSISTVSNAQSKARAMIAGNVSLAHAVEEIERMLK